MLKGKTFTQKLSITMPFFSLRKNGLSKRLAAASFFAYEDKGGEDSAPRCVHSLSANRLIEGSAKEFQDPAKI